MQHTGYVALARQNGRSHRVCLDFFCFFFLSRKKEDKLMKHQKFLTLQGYFKTDSYITFAL
jgi:hypothetical protein